MKIRKESRLRVFDNRVLRQLCGPNRVLRQVCGPNRVLRQVCGPNRENVKKTA